MSERLIPSRLTLIRLRRQEQLFKRMRKTLEDARNSTIQKIRALVEELERDRKIVSSIMRSIGDYYLIGVGKMGLDKVRFIADFNPKTVTVEIKEKMVGGTKITGFVVSGVQTKPVYGLVETPPELDIAIKQLVDSLNTIFAFVERENLFYTLLAKVKEYQRMMNAIDNVILPKIQNTIKFIRLMLDEQEREGFIRQKIITEGY